MSTSDGIQLTKTTDDELVTDIVTEASKAQTAQDALTHLQIHSNMLKNTQSAFREALSSCCRELSDACMFQIRSDWRGENYFKPGAAFSDAREEATRTGGISHLFEKIIEHLDADEKNTLGDYEHGYVPRESERVFRLFASRVLSLDASLDEALLSLKVEKSEENKELLKTQRADVRGLLEMPTSTPIEVGSIPPSLILDHESETSQAGSEQEESDHSAEETEGGDVEDSDVSEE